MTTAWRKSTFSGITECVEVAGTDSGKVLVRNSKQRDGDVLTCTADEWRAFVDSIKSGDMDD